MSHYHLIIPVSKEEVAILKKYFVEYLEECGGITIAVIPFRAGIKPSEEMEDVVRNLFIRLIMMVESNQFERLN